MVSIVIQVSGGVVSGVFVRGISKYDVEWILEDFDDNPELSSVVDHVHDDGGYTEI